MLPESAFLAKPIRSLWGDFEALVEEEDWAHANAGHITVRPNATSVSMRLRKRFFLSKGHLNRPSPVRF